MAATIVAVPLFVLETGSTVEAGSDELTLDNKWKGSDVHYVALFAKNSSWGWLFPAFGENRRKLKDVGGSRFQLNHDSFMKAFHSLE